MRTGIVVREITFDGGVGRCVGSLLPRLRGLEPTLFTSRSDLAWPRTHLVPTPRVTNLLRTIPHARIFQRAVDRAKAAGEIDVTHAHDGILVRPDLLSLYGSMTQFLHEAMRWRYRNLHPAAWTAHAFERHITRRARRVIALSNGLAEAIHRYDGVERERIRVVHPGVDPREFAPRRDAHRIRKKHGIPPEAPLILFVANEYERKGLAPLIEAFAQLRDQDWRLLLVGARDPAPYLEQARKRGVGPRVAYAGKIRGHELAPYYSAATLLCVPSFLEPFGLVFLESMACGTPVVTTRNDGARDLIRDGKDGLLVDLPPRPQALTAAIEAVALEPRTMGRSALARSKRFRWEKTAEGNRKVYEEVSSR